MMMLSSISAYMYDKLNRTCLKVIRVYTSLGQHGIQKDYSQTTVDRIPHGT